MRTKYLLTIFSIVLFAAVSFTSQTNPLVGKWENSGVFKGDPYKFLAIFRANGSFDGFMNNKEFVSGTYHMNHDTLYMSDPTCNAKYEGKYKVEFFGQLDSLKFHVIQDTCKGRVEGTNGFLFKRVRQAVKK
ncbi:hypothetical protein [Mucilaginibacter gossypii]|uniref:DUF2147 domain-containing protein n=1 Tax=Mucilaginibacter gossypii TaxID=551996 RepID=A0A1G8A2G6_9SPHI|nr:hypothetical protein [Mucilaginibacter gossypii]SDH15051.1 hypothetical protein SAMN05192573_10772 [Mucilaginibacter gossypii]